MKERNWLQQIRTYFSGLLHNAKLKTAQIDKMGAKLLADTDKNTMYKSHTSLDVFCDKFSDRVQNKYVIYTKDLKREQGIDYIPVYMTMFL